MDLICGENISVRNLASVFVMEKDCGTGEERFLLLYRKGSRVLKRPMWVGPGGHFEPGEMSSPTECALRELSEETGIGAEEIDMLRLKYISLRLYEGEIRYNYYFFARLKEPLKQLPKSAEGEFKWIGAGEIGGLDMPFNAKECLLHYLREGRFDDNVYAVPTFGEGLKPAAAFERLTEYEY